MSTIEYVDQDPNKKSLNLNSIEQYYQTKYKATRRLLQPGDTASLATKACPFPHYNPLFTYKRYYYADEDTDNDESVTFDLQRRKVLKAKKMISTKPGAESLKSESGNERYADYSISIYDPYFQDLGENYVAPDKHFRQYSAIAQDDENKSPYYYLADGSFDQDNKAVRDELGVLTDMALPESANLADRAVYQAVCSTFEYGEGADNKIGSYRQSNPYELATALSNMRMQVSRFDELSLSPRFYYVIQDLRRQESLSQSNAHLADYGAECASVHSRNELAETAQFASVQYLQTNSGRFKLSPEVRYLVDYYNKSHIRADPVIAVKQDKSYFYKLVQPVKQYLDKIPDKQMAIDPEIKRRITQIYQMHNTESESDELAFERLTPYPQLYPANYAIELRSRIDEDQAEAEKIYLVKELIRYYLQYVIAHQSIRLRFRDITLSSRSCHELMSYAQSLCACFLSECMAMHQYIERCVFVRRRCEQVESKAVALGETYLAYISSQRVAWYIEQESEPQDSNIYEIEDQKYLIQLKTELDDLRVVDIEKLWKKQLV